MPSPAAHWWLMSTSCRASSRAQIPGDRGVQGRLALDTPIHDCTSISVLGPPTKPAPPRRGSAAHVEELISRPVGRCRRGPGTGTSARPPKPLRDRLVYHFRPRPAGKPTPRAMSRLGASVLAAHIAGHPSAPGSRPGDVSPARRARAHRLSEHRRDSRRRPPPSTSPRGPSSVNVSLRSVMPA